MYAIKMESDKSLHSTITSTIYQGERNSDTLVFLIPQTYEEINMADCSMLLRYILPSGTGKSEQLEMDALPYKEYFQFRLPIKTRFTEHAGRIELWLTAVNMYDDIVLKTGTTSVTIKPSKNIINYFSQGDKDQLDLMSADIERLKQEKADSLLYDDEEKLLYLTAQGVLIGDAADMKTMVNEELIIIEDDVIEVPDEMSGKVGVNPLILVD